MSILLKALSTASSILTKPAAILHRKGAKHPEFCVEPNPKGSCTDTAILRREARLEASGFQMSHCIRKLQMLHAKLYKSAEGNKKINMKSGLVM